jgi:hypothetical protein
MYKFVAIPPAEVVKLWRGILRVLESAPDTPSIINSSIYPLTGRGRRKKPQKLALE